MDQTLSLFTLSLEKKVNLVLKRAESMNDYMCAFLPHYQRKSGNLFDTQTPRRKKRKTSLVTTRFTGNFDSIVYSVVGTYMKRNDAAGLAKKITEKLSFGKDKSEQFWDCLLLGVAVCQLSKDAAAASTNSSYEPSVGFWLDAILQTIDDSSDRNVIFDNPFDVKSVPSKYRYKLHLCCTLLLQGILGSSENVTKFRALLEARAGNEFSVEEVCFMLLLNTWPNIFDSVVFTLKSQKTLSNYSKSHSWRFGNDEMIEDLFIPSLRYPTRNSSRTWKVEHNFEVVPESLKKGFRTINEKERVLGGFYREDRHSCTLIRIANQRMLLEWAQAGIINAAIALYFRRNKKYKEYASYSPRILDIQLCFDDASRFFCLKLHDDNAKSQLTDIVTGYEVNASSSLLLFVVVGMSLFLRNWDYLAPLQPPVEKKLAESFWTVLATSPPFSSSSFAKYSNCAFYYVPPLHLPQPHPGGSKKEDEEEEKEEEEAEEERQVKRIGRFIVEYLLNRNIIETQIYHFYVGEALTYDTFDLKPLGEVERCCNDEKLIVSTASALSVLTKRRICEDSNDEQRMRKKSYIKYRESEKYLLKYFNDCVNESL